MLDPRVLFSAEGLVSLAVMEIVLGIDNIVLVAVLSQKVAARRRTRVRRLGISLALVLRVGLLLTLSWIMSLTRPLFHVLGQAFSGRDLVLLVGGLFLMAKATSELHERLAQGAAADEPAARGGEGNAGFGVTLAQILALDVVFSLDSVITAVGMARAVVIMIAAMVIAVGVMFVFADVISDFITRTPSMKVLAARVPAAHRRAARRRRLRAPHRQGLRLLRDGVRARRRARQHARPQERGAGAPERRPMTVRHPLPIVLAAVLLTLAAARAARAQGEAGFAPAPAAGGTGFGAPGQFVISMGPTTDQHLFFHKQSGGGWQLQLSPSLDYFVTPRLAVGGVLGYHHESGGAGTNANGTDIITFGVRASTNFDFNDRFGVWPLVGLFYDHTSQNHGSTTNTWLELYVPFLFHLAPHFFVGAGPSFQLDLSGPDANQFGIDSVLGGWF